MLDMQMYDAAFPADDGLSEFCRCQVFMGTGFFVHLRAYLYLSNDVRVLPQQHVGLIANILFDFSQ